MKALLHILLILPLNVVYADNGVIDIQSPYSVNDTASRLESTLLNKGMTVFNRIQHSQAADEVGIELRQTELIIFGNPKIGSQVMRCQQSAAIDLPQKALIWEDEHGGTWISYNAPSYIQKRHGVTGCDAVLDKIGKAIPGLIQKSIAE